MSNFANYLIKLFGIFFIFDQHFSKISRLFGDKHSNTMVFIVDIFYVIEPL